MDGRKTIWRGRRLCFLLLLLLAGLPGIGRAGLYTYDFPTCVTNNKPEDAQTGSQFFVDVSPVSGNPQQVLFTFRNAGPAGSSITDVYFDDGTLLGIASITNGPGVSFSQGASPPNLPGRNNITPAFDVTAGFLADSDPEVQPNGVNPGEWLGITFNLIEDQVFESVISALALAGEEDGGLRIGIKVQGFDGGGSEAFINDPEPVPVPGAVLLGLLGLSATGLTLRRFA